MGVTFILIISSILIYLVFIFSKRIKKLEQDVSQLKEHFQHLENMSKVDCTDPIITKTSLEVDKNQVNTATESSSITSTLSEKQISPEENKVTTSEIQENLHPSNKPSAFEERLNQLFDFVRQNVLTVIGIFTLVIGIGYFVNYAIDRNWIGETARVILGMLIGATLVVVGHRLRKNYESFGSIIAGGGIAVFYLTITIAFQVYEMFSQGTAFTILAVITLFTVILAFKYNSQVINTIALIGGFLSPLFVTTGTSNYIFLFSYITVLNIGMLIISYIKNWKSIGYIAFAFTTIYFISWFTVNRFSETIYFLMIHYIIFYAFALQNYFRKKQLSQAEIFMLLMVNITLVMGSLFYFTKANIHGFSFFYLVIAVANLVLAYYKTPGHRIKSVAYSVFTGIAISLITIAIALELQTKYITILWAIEGSLILFIWNKTRQIIFKYVFFAVFTLTLISLSVTWTDYFYTDHEPKMLFFNNIFLTSFVVIASILFNLFYLKNDQDNPTNISLERVFRAISYIVIYLAISLDLNSHYTNLDYGYLIIINLIYSLYFVFVLLLIKKALGLSESFIHVLIFLVMIISIITVSFPDITHTIVHKDKTYDLLFYSFYLTYLVPLIVTLFAIIPKNNYLKKDINYWYIAATIVAVLSFQLYQFYYLANWDGQKDDYYYTNHYIIFYLPIIWTILSAFTIYLGIRKNNSNINKVGFALLGITIAKLYSYDVWQLDKISRIIAFIVLGIILLFSSFLFERLKRILSRMVENKNSTPDKNSQTNDKEKD